MKEIQNYLNTILNDHDTVIIGVSGGPDSVCLLDLLIKLNKNLNIVCAVVNHHIRKESDTEYSYMEKYCKEHNLIFEGMDITKYNNANFESYARKQRYTFFEKLYSKYHARYILTAHHGDDLIETILMRITRGSNLSGYIGIKLLDGKYLRPLLYVTKEDIIKYNEDNHLKYFIDKTNTDDNHTRNRYRKNILPFLKKENPLVHLKYLSFSNELTKYEQFINKYIHNIKDLKDKKGINIDVFLKEEPLIQERIIINEIKQIQKDYEFPVNNNILTNILKLIKSNKANSEIDLFGNFIAQKAYNKFSIKEKKEVEGYSEIFNKEFVYDEYTIRLVDKVDSNNNFIIRLNSKDLKLPLIIRSKKDNDIIAIKKVGHKRINNLFIDKKIPLDERKIWPIVTDSNNKLLWVPGIQKSEFAKEKNENYDIILLCERKKDK